jgi:hypothetical protein
MSEAEAGLGMHAAHKASHAQVANVPAQLLVQQHVAAAAMKGRKASCILQTRKVARAAL